MSKTTTELALERIETLLRLSVSQNQRVEHMLGMLLLGQNVGQPLLPEAALAVAAQMNSGRELVISVLQTLSQPSDEERQRLEDQKRLEDQLLASIKAKA